MPRPRRSFRGRPGKKLDHTRWEVSTGQFLAQSAGSVAFNFSAAATQPATLLRMRGEILGFIDAVATPGVLVSVTYGIILVPEGTGTTVLFDPLLDGNAPWLLWGTGILGYEEMVTDVVDVPGISSFRNVIDNKAMRIIRPDVEMQFVMNNATIGTAHATALTVALRWLLGF